MPPLHVSLIIAVITVVIVVVLQWSSKSRVRSARLPDFQPGPIHHQTLSDSLDTRVRRFEPVFAEVYPRSHAEWIDGFKRDAEPEPEVAIWEAMAFAYQSFTQKRTLSLDAKKETFGLLLVRSSADEQSTLSGADLRYLSRADAQELLRLYSAAPQPVQFISR